MTGKKKQYTRYMRVKVVIEVDGSKTDQDMDDHIEEIVATVVSECHYSVVFDGLVEAGIDCDNAIEVPVRIIDTELVDTTSD